MQKPPVKEAIDWQDIHRRIDQLSNAIDGNWQADPAHVHTTLNRRARELAVPLHNATAAEQVMELLEFSLANERYGIGSAFVREVCPLTQFTPVPCTPSFVLGIINVRGEIISVVDIRKFFALPETGLPDLNKIIIVYNDAVAPGKPMLFGILADFIVEVREVAVAAIQPPSNITGIRADYLLGVTANGLAVIDAEKLLADKAVIVDENV
ncbi:MAG: chemotaxis protein CheW [Verrucomicrobiaceae bacterium]|nr:chemotaxis protein CheW [Verrucomicrobiaceae bacterium]